ncbi:MAG: hypothetical protein U9R47_02060, partial [Actinomycetota bacterium]|nr:hypothetical protein [Actinomycetota bacterium]
MDTETSSRGRDRLIAAGRALLAATVLLVVLALATSGSVRTFSVVVLGLLIPVVALATSAAERRRIGH